MSSRGARRATWRSRGIRCSHGIASLPLVARNDKRKLSEVPCKKHFYDLIKIIWLGQASHHADEYNGWILVDVLMMDAVVVLLECTTAILEFARTPADRGDGYR